MSERDKPYYERDEIVVLRTDLHPDGRKYWKEIQRSAVPNNRLKAELYELLGMYQYLGVTGDAYGVIYEYYLTRRSQKNGLLGTVLDNWSSEWNSKLTSLYFVTHHIIPF